MADIKLTRRQEKMLRQYEMEFQDIKGEIAEIGFILQGSVTERWMVCGKPSCSCSKDADARHGPYYQLSWKTDAKTNSIYLTEKQADLCREWLQNNRGLETIIKRLRSLSLRVASLYKIDIK